MQSHCPNAQILSAEMCRGGGETFPTCSAILQHGGMFPILNCSCSFRDELVESNVR